ncbi:response regulator transcription factor, partial [Nitrolancea hollandica]
GVAAYCTKDMALSEIVLTIRRVAEGEVLIDEILAARPGLATLLRIKRTTLIRTKQDLVGLSHREAAILDCIVRGESNKEIALRLGISEQTVKTHVAAILRHLGANNRTAAAMTAVKRGWVTLDP